MSPSKQQKLDLALRAAVANGNIHAIRAALAAGADPGWLADNPFVSGEQRLPAFFWAAAKGNGQVIRFLLEMGLDPAVQDNLGRTALFVVPDTMDGTQAFELLCQAGVDPLLPALDGSQARNPIQQQGQEQSARSWKAPRPTLGPSKRPEEEDED